MSTDPIHKFVEAMGLMFQHDGAPRIAGHILGYLLIEGEPRTLQQLTERLSISKASASTNCRLLEGRGLLRRVSPVGSRQDAWQAVSEPNRQMLNTLAQRFRRNAETIAEISSTFPSDRADARERVNHFADFYRLSADFIEEWRDRVSDPGRQVSEAAKK